MLWHLKEATLYTFRNAFRLLYAVFFGTYVISGWVKEFGPIDTIVYKFIIPKFLIFTVGYFITPYPLWVLVVVSFFPIPIAMTFFFLTMIVVFIQ